MAATFVLLKRVELTSSAGSILIDSLPSSGYTDLRIDGSFRSDSTGNVGTVVVNMAINGSTANRDNRRLYGANTPGEDQGTGTGGPQSQTSSGLANTFSNISWYISDYLSSNYKPYRIDSGAANNNATYWEHDTVSGLWSNSSAITSLTFSPSAGNFVTGTTVSVYGISKQNQTPTVAPKADGGSIIVNDGTYWYHAFLSSGVFTPQTPLTCSALVVGGGGGNGGYAGGGGAGGLVYSATNSLTTTNYAVTIGAGGAARTASEAGLGNSGSNTTFNSLTAGGGGGGGSDTAINGANGAATNGSGGGGGYGSYGGTGNGTGGNGGAGNGAPGGTVANYSSGGGGGAGANGANATAQDGGNGGAGLNTYSSWATATTTGVSGYYAGGGGGANGNGASGVGGTGGAGGGGNGHKWNTGGSTSGVANTGGGGGGNSQLSYGVGGAGGSGIVIIRYPMA